MVTNLLELLLLGVIQGIVEWLPISSEGQVVLITLQFLALSLEEAISIALFLHLGTMFVVLIIYRRDFFLMFRYLLKLFLPFIYFWKKDVDEVLILGDDALIEVHSLLKLFFWGILGTALTGVPTLLLLDDLWNALGSHLNVDLGSLATAVIGILLLITGFVLSRQHAFDASIDETFRDLHQLKWYEMLIIGMCQGLAILPGISRSGMTITALLLLKVKREESLRGSFLLLVPASLGAVSLELIRGQIEFSMVNMAFHVGSNIRLSLVDVIMLLMVTFFVGYATIQYFLRQIASDKIRFDQFCYVLGVLALIAGAVGVIMSL